MARTAVPAPTTGEPDPLADFYAYGQPNWDGYGASPITPSTINATRIMLRMLPRTFGNPHIAPGADGSIGFEWLLKTGPLVKLFIDIGPGITWSAYWRRKDGEVGKYPRRKILSFETSVTLAHLFQRLSI
jgi:hypothetical protein